MNLNNSIAFVVDPQIQYSTPASRVDDYFSTMIRKISEVLFANKYTVFLGDLTEFPVLDMAGLIVLVNLLQKYKEAGGKAYSLIGNHDIYNWSIPSVNKTTLGLLSRLGLVQIIDNSQEIEEAVEEVHIDNWVIQCTSLKDPRSKLEKAKQDNSILIGHNYYAFERDKKHSLEYEDLKDLNYKFIFLGHEHKNYQPKIIEGSTLYRPGSLGRGKADPYNFDRKIQYYQLSLDTGKVRAVDVQYESASEVFSLEANEKHNDSTPQYVYDMEELMKSFKNKKTVNISIKKMLEDNTEIPDKVVEFIKDCYEQCQLEFV